MLKFTVFLIIVFTGIQLYAITFEKVLFNISTEAIRQLFFIYLFTITIISLKTIRINKYIKDVLIIFLLFLSCLLISVFRSPVVFYGITDIVKLTYILLAFLIFSTFISIYGVENSSKIIRKYIFIAFLLFLMGVMVNILRGNIISPDTGEFLLSGTTGRAISAFFCSIIAIYFYCNYLNEKKYIYILSFIVSSSLIFLSFTRIALMGFSIAFLIISIAYKRYKMLFIFSIFFIMVMSFFIDSLIKETFVVEGLESLSGKNLLEIFYLIRLTGREQFWTITFDSFLKSPIFGNGSGFSDFLIKSETMGQVEQVHNDYLKVLADLGIIGLILYLAIYLIMFFNAWKNYNKDKRKKYYFFIFVATLVQILIFSLTDNVIAYAPYLLVYVFAFYTLLTYPKSEVRDENSIYN